MFGKGEPYRSEQERLVAAKFPREVSSVFKPQVNQPDLNQVLRMLGYSNPDRVRPNVWSIAKSVIEEVKFIAQPIVHFTRMAIESCDDDTLVIETGAVFHCEAFQKYFLNCDEIFSFVLTLGKSFDEVGAEQIAKDQILEAIVLETAGWLVIEQATKQLAIHLRDIARGDGRQLSRRMAPGYGYKIGGRKCEWPLEEQRLLFELFDHEMLPVQLLSSCTMVPKMSRSGVYGLRPS